jgi:uncharacterized coiled-coil protein SlyX
MLDWLKNLISPSDPLSDELDRRIAEADARIAAKEKIFKDLTDSVNKKTVEVERLRDKINRQEKTLKKNLN